MPRRSELCSDLRTTQFLPTELSELSVEITTDSIVFSYAQGHVTEMLSLGPYNFRNRSSKKASHTCATLHPLAAAIASKAFFKPRLGLVLLGADHEHYFLQVDGENLWKYIWWIRVIYLAASTHSVGAVR